ncbi:dihydrodipicolinate reductase [Phycisphaerales bacterium AB-hyl4]|uniref:Dihydrodipicolinate reductase n=1 Tax=Natronomicrosphaera hydrolytica TaxID=3242702 RepID=A0ABV4U5Z0_9BACT
MQRIIVIGMGPIGIGCARSVLAESGIKLVGMVDMDPAKSGQTASELRGKPAEVVDQKHEPKVTTDISEALDANPDAAIIATTSHFDEVAQLVRPLLERGVSVVSSCEQMAWPWYQHAALAEEIDALAQQAGRVVLGTGVNPGFAMDALAVMLSSMVRRVNKVRCVRRVNAAVRRQPLQMKIGATLSTTRFREAVAAGKVGHIGLAESAAMLATALGGDVRAGGIEQTIEPVIAKAPTPSLIGLIGPGEVTGLQQIARWQDEHDRTRIELDLTMAIGLEDPKDKIVLDGPVQVVMKVNGGLPGDSATVAALLNQVRQIHRLKPGLRTMLDCPPAGCGFK